MSWDHERVDEVPAECPKCANGGDVGVIEKWYRGPLYDRRYDELQYRCITCGYQFATKTVDAERPK